MQLSLPTDCFSVAVLMCPHVYLAWEFRRRTGAWGTEGKLAKTASSGSLTARFVNDMEQLRSCMHCACASRGTCVAGVALCGKRTWAPPASRKAAALLLPGGCVCWLGLESRGCRASRMTAVPGGREWTCLPSLRLLASPASRLACTWPILGSTNSVHSVSSEATGVTDSVSETRGVCV